ncbi:hypothetical protein ACLKMH_03565 [Psychromonas sp. KJ10-10]|uniref:hypothetical protein n=1 Tax=Psychromonas sp. KJ10-10 TaxID=3391823 RepID=UPI0039B5AA37
MKLSKKLHLQGLGLAMIALMSLPALATETINAVVIDGYPAKSMWVHEFSNFFIPEVNKQTLLKLATTLLNGKSLMVVQSSNLKVY